MKWYYFPLISGLLCLLGTPARAMTYVFGQGGLLRPTQQTAQDQVNLSGSSYGFGAGVRIRYIEVEALYSSGKAEADITHDNQKNKLLHAQSSLILAGNFYLTKFAYLRFGYGLHSVEQEFANALGAVSAEGAKREYNLVEKENLGA